jgi:hypothetical protein
LSSNPNISRSARVEVLDIRADVLDIRADEHYGMMAGKLMEDLNRIGDKQGRGMHGCD